MDFSKRQADPRRHMVGITFVILFHAFIVYALVTGLAKKVVDVVRAPIETKVIEEVKPPPPPPEIVVPPPPRLEAPPPPFIPPPEVQIANPPPQQPTITATPTPPPVAQTIAPAPPPAAPPAPPAPKPAVVAAGTVCPKMTKPEIPRRALVERRSGTVRARITVRGGKVVNVQIMNSAAGGIFDTAIRNAMMQYECVSGAEDVVAEQEFVFKVDE